MTQEGDLLAGRYRLKEPLATGGMGVVWSARDEVLARRVAVKILHPNLAGDASFVERFQHEAIAAARLAHPNIVAIYDTGTESDDNGDPRNYIVMEFCSKGSLPQAMPELPLSPDRVCAIGGDICDALAYAHEVGVIHRDIKPANVLVADDDTLKVADFGIAKAAFTQGDITTTGKILGTVTHISPEQARGEEPDPRSDIYSLGVMLYELLAGRPPFQNESLVATAMAHVNDPPPPPRSIRGGIPRRLEEVILKALAKDPDERFTTADEMKHALLDVGGGSTSVLPAVSRSREPSTTPEGVAGSARWLLRVLIGIALAIGVAFLVAFLADQPGGPEGSQRGNADTTEAQPLSLAIPPVAFDPYGDGEEHSGDAHLVADDDPGSAWSTETYNDPLASQGKPGVGLLFDLGGVRAVVEVEILWATPGADFQVLYSDQVPPNEAAMQSFGDVAGTGEIGTVKGEASGRYWLVWITEVPTGGRASIAEVTFRGP